MNRIQLKNLVKECISEINLIKEGMSVDVSGIDMRKENLKTLGGISHELCELLKVKMNDITPDGDSDYFDSTGTINFYATDLSVKEAIDIFRKMHDFFKSKGIRYGVHSDTSKMTHKRVYRIDITGNPFGSEPQVPSLHISYGTAQTLFVDILHLPNAYKDYGLTVNVDELQKAINNASDDVIDDKYLGYIQQLEEMIEYAKKHGLKQISGG